MDVKIGTIFLLFSLIISYPYAMKHFLSYVSSAKKEVRPSLRKRYISTLIIKTQSIYTRTSSTGYVRMAEVCEFAYHIVRAERFR